MLLIISYIQQFKSQISKWQFKNDIKNIIILIASVIKLNVFIKKYFNNNFCTYICKIYYLNKYNKHNLNKLFKIVKINLI